MKTLGIFWSALLILTLSAVAQAPTPFLLKPGCHYAIGFQDNIAPGYPAAQPQQPQAQPASGARNVAVYRVINTAGDQQWYRIRMVVRAPQGGWITPPGAPDVWVNVTYAVWVQEVMR